VLLGYVFNVDCRVVVDNSSTTGFLRQKELIDDKSDMIPRMRKRVAWLVTLRQ